MTCVPTTEEVPTSRELLGSPGPEATHRLQYGKPTKASTQRITWHLVGGCFRARDAVIAAGVWAATSSIDQDDFKYQCRLCFGELRANASTKAKQTVVSGAPTAEAIAKLAEETPSESTEEDRYGRSEQNLRCWFEISLIKCNLIEPSKILRIEF